MAEPSLESPWDLSFAAWSLAPAALCRGAEAVEQEFHAEIVHGAAKIDRRLAAGVHGGQVKGMAGAGDHCELFGDLAIGRFIEFLPHDGIAKIGHLVRGPVGAAGHALKQVHLAAQSVVSFVLPR